MILALPAKRDSPTMCSSLTGLVSLWVNMERGPQPHGAVFQAHKLASQSSTQGGCSARGHAAGFAGVHSRYATTAAPGTRYPTAATAIAAGPPASPVLDTHRAQANAFDPATSAYSGT